MSDNTSRICKSCKQLTYKGERCRHCGWPDPETQPKLYLAFLKRAVKRAEALAKKRGISLPSQRKVKR